MSDHIILKAGSDRATKYRLEPTPICQELVSYLQNYEDKIPKLTITYSTNPKNNFCTLKSGCLGCAPSESKEPAPQYKLYFMFSFGVIWGQFAITRECAEEKLPLIWEKFSHSEESYFKKQPIVKSEFKYTYYVLNEEGMIVYNILNKYTPNIDLLKTIFSIRADLFTITSDKPQNGELFFTKSKVIKELLSFRVKLFLHSSDVQNNLPLLVEFFSCCQDNISRG